MNQPSLTDPGLISIEPASIEYYNPALPQPPEPEADPTLEFDENKPVPYHRIPQMALYRHAHALGHFKARRDKMRLGLDRVIERGPQTLVTADQVIRAVRAQACLTDDNRWVEPARHLVVSTESSGPIAAQGVILATGSHRQQVVAAQLPPTEAPQNN